MNARKLKARIIEIYGSQWKFAHAIGVQEAIVSRVLKGKIPLSDSSIGTWAAALRVNEEEITVDQIVKKVTKQ